MHEKHTTLIKKSFLLEERNDFQATFLTTIATQYTPFTAMGNASIL